jgi:class 3 adenylate cyclase/DNA-binding response OmpR family regulator
MLQSAGYPVELAEGQKRALELAAGGQIEAAIVFDLADLAQELRRKVRKTIVLGRTDQTQAHALPVEALDAQKLLEQLRATSSARSAAGETGLAPIILTINTCKLDLAGRTFVDRNGREVQLTRCETALLAAFVESPCRVLARNQLRHAVAGHGAQPYDRNIDMLVARLRRKIEADPKTPAFIITVPGLGYKFVVRPHSAADAKSQPGIEPELQTEARDAWVSQSALDKVTPTNLPDRIGLTHFEPARRQVSVLSCRLVGAAALAANLDPEDFSSTVRHFQGICSSVISQWGGAVTHSVADEILALFGYPKGHENDAERAVHAGLDLIAKIGEAFSPSGEPLQARIAIATSLVLIGDNQSVAGEAIITAARLLNATNPSSVMVTSSTRKLLSGAFVCDDPQFCDLQGASKPVIACRVTGKRAIGSRFDAGRARKRLQLVGRQHELQQMSNLWKRVKSGKGQVVLVCGETGIGKSSLCRAWLDGIADEPHIVLRNQCSPYHTNRPFYPVATQLEHAARFERGDSSEVKLKKLEILLSAAGSAALVDIPLLAALLSLPTERFYASPVLTPQRQRDLTIAALLRQILSLARTRPVVLKVADVHWADSSTLELLDRCISSIKAARVFVLCTFRPEFSPHWLDESHVTMLRLDRLSREQIGNIISDVAGGKELSCGVQEQIITKADGVPLFAEELTKAALEPAPVKDAGDRYHCTGSLPAIAMPTTLLGLLTARLDKLGPSKEIAQTAATIGREFSYRLLAAVAPLSGASLQSTLDHIGSCGLISVRGEPPHATYVFKHALVQDAAYATMVRSKREQLHSRIANALMTEFPEEVEAQPELIVYHLAQAGLNEKAIEFLRKAGQAIERSANAEAIGRLKRIRELLLLLSEKSLSEDQAPHHAAFGLNMTGGAWSELAFRPASGCQVVEAGL